MARIAALRAGLPDIVPGVTINRFCSSGLQSIAMAADRIRAGSAQDHHRRRQRIDVACSRWPATSSLPIPGSSTTVPRSTWAWASQPSACSGSTASSREEQDAFSLRSHRMRCTHRLRAPFDRRDRPVSTGCTQGRRTARGHLDGGAGQTEARLSRAGNRHRGQLLADSDGAAAALVMSESKARELGLKPMARFVSFAVAGVPPEIMGIGPAVAIPKALALAGSEARRHRCDRIERGLRRAGAGGDPPGWPRTWSASTSTAARSRWAIRWAAPARSSRPPFCAR